MGRIPSFATNTRLAIVPAEGGTPRSITDDFDESARFDGVETGRHLLRCVAEDRRHISSDWIRRLEKPFALQRRMI